MNITAYLKLMRLDKPVGTLLLLWSTLWGLWIAGDSQPDAKISFILLIGTILMRSAGCVINDIADYKFDQKVERTKNRPLANGTIKTYQAILLFVILLIPSISLVFLLNFSSLLLAIFFGLIVIFYPFSKRFIKIPQIVLGLAFASPILFAHTALLNKITITSIIFFLSAVVWALIYDTYYALVDRNDDIKIAINSSAIYFQGKEIKFLTLANLAFFGLLALGGFIAKLNYWYYLFLLFAFIIAIWHLIYCRKLSPERCLTAFEQNNWIGGLIFIGIVLAHLP